MPLLKGKSNIGHNVREMEEHGHPHKQAVAAALRTALDDETLNSASYKAARKAGAVMSSAHDDTYAKPVTAMTVADINEKNKNLWGNVGPTESQATAPELAGTRVSRNVPVWTGAGIGDEGAEDAGRIISPAQRRQVAKATQGGADPMAETYAHAKANKLNRKDPGPAKAGYGRFAAEIQHSEGKDEVQPTQSDPPDRRGDNLLGEPAVAGERDAEAPKPKWSPEEVIRQQQAAVKQNPNEAKRIKEGKWRGEFAEDDLAQGTESMPPEGQADGVKTLSTGLKSDDPILGHTVAAKARKPQERLNSMRQELVRHAMTQGGGAKAQAVGKKIEVHIAKYGQE